MWGELALSLQTGNMYVMAIMAFAFIALVIILERFIMMQFVYNLEFNRFLNNIKKMITSEDFERAMNFCKSVSKTSLPKIALKSLQAVENDPSSVRGTIEEETIEFVPKIEKRLGGLPAIATLILLVGILGTIDELWWAFHSIDVLDTAKKQASLATGIASSLNPTALGILVCMLILFSHQILKGMAVAVIEHIHLGVAVLSNLLIPPEMAFVAAQAAPVQAELGDHADLGNDEDVNDTNSLNEDLSDDAFDDAAVEDIKDEEEII